MQKGALRYCLRRWLPACPSSPRTCPPTPVSSPTAKPDCSATRPANWQQPSIVWKLPTPTPPSEKPDAEGCPRRLGPGTTVPIVLLAPISAFSRHNPVAAPVLLPRGTGYIGTPIAQ